MNSQDKWQPDKLLEVSGAYWQACTLHAAVKLDIFTRLGKDRIGAQRLAELICVDEDGVERLLNALVAMQLLNKKGERFYNTDFSLVFLTKNSDQYIGHMIMHHHHLVASWGRMDEAVREGRPVRSRVSFSDPETREAFLMGMFNNAMLIAPRLAKSLDLADRNHLLDMGGGPGTYAVHFCKNNPGLRASVFDLSTTRAFAEKIIARFGMQDRVDFIPGDYVEESIPGHYDAVWMSHILHSEGPEGCQAMIQKAHQVLEPGGRIIIHDFILDDDGGGPLFPALFSLNMLVGTPKGRSYSEQEIRQMLTGAGFRDIERSDFVGPTESGLVMACKP